MSHPNNNRPPSQTGSTQKLTLVIMAAVSFIALVILIAWVALGMIQQKIQQDTGNALGHCSANHPGITDPLGRK